MPPLFYLILNQPMKQVAKHPYLGVIIDSKVSLSAHVDHVISKASFIRRNLCKCNKEVKCMAYLCLVLTSLE